MNTPICDFVENYIRKDGVRLHMPGHKGQYGYGGDITEITGADSLYAPSGIVAESEENGGRIFGCPTFYSTEGASHTIRAMLYLACLFGGKGKILAARNVHKAFVSAAALLDLEVDWLYPEAGNYLSCPIPPEALDAALSKAPYKAVYVTSPDYLGGMQDIAALSKVCHAHGALLLVDNAHGGYLRFLEESLFPADLGADMVCTSAHKTLPVLTGGAYLHLGGGVAKHLSPHVKGALALFGSTSPSFLILQSLDMANVRLLDFGERLSAFLPLMEAAREALGKVGYTLFDGEPLKITILPKPYGYTGEAVAAFLEENNIYPEFYDQDFLVLMATPETGADGIHRLVKALLSLPKKEAIGERPPSTEVPRRRRSFREAMFLPRETIPAGEGAGRILAAETVGCPPAVPLVMAGEEIPSSMAPVFAYYGMETLTVLQNNI